MLSMWQNRFGQIDVKIDNNFSISMGAISRITGPILGLFVLKCLFMMNPNENLKKKVEKFATCHMHTWKGLNSPVYSR